MANKERPRTKAQFQCVKIDDLPWIPRFNPQEHKWLPWYVRQYIRYSKSWSYTPAGGFMKQSQKEEWINIHYVEEKADEAKKP